ncbi:MAG: serpin family protein [Saprospiraceae bacterium]|nr:serpin family protein [Saprospiraceae bacterium]
MKTGPIALIFALMSILGCEKEEPLKLDPNPDVDKLETSIQSFQWNLFHSVLDARLNDDNIVISPLSIASALYMTLNGARGETKIAMESALDLAPSDRELFDQVQAVLMDQLQSNHSNTELSQANAIFYDKNRMTVDGEFADLMTQYFDARLFDLVFQEETALPTINDWVKESTEGRIEKIIEEIDPVEVMFLINALYFTGDWNLPFAEDATSIQSFTKEDGSSVDVPMMHKDQTLTYFEGNDLQAVEMAFADTNYSMQFLLPPVDQSVRSFAAELTAERLADLANTDLREGRIIFQLPRFEIAYEVVLNEALKSMGMGLAFDRQAADLSGLGSAPEGNLFINRVNHKTYLKIDEKGAEGAAVTSVGVGVTSLPPVLRFDRPFVYLLRHRSTHVIIFIGIMDNPRAQ